MCLLAQLWPILETFRLIGSFPLKRKRGSRQLVSVQKHEYIPQYFVASAMVISSTLACMVWIDFWKVIQIMSNYKDKFTDAATFFFIYSACHLLHFCLTLNTFLVRRKLALFLNYLCQANLTQDVKGRRKPWVYFYVSFSFTSVCLTTAGLSMLIHGDTEIISHTASDHVKITIFAPVSALYMVWMYGPMQVFVILFAHVCYSLMDWIERIHLSIANSTSKESKIFDEYILTQECLNLFRNGLQKANEIFTCHLASVIVLVTISLVASVYGMLTFCSCVLESDLSLNDLTHKGFIIMMAGYVVYSLKLFFTLAFMNALSHQVNQKLKTLKEKVLEMDLLMENEMKIQSRSLSKVIHIMDGFKGFDCCGFFTLGRPRFTSISATLITYIIILLQFRTTTGGPGGDAGYPNGNQTN